ncbi:hypothetical protein EDB95_3369 [Dinghuibacter silviterrae]|uniref:Uncharacterized protein n=2 Tax=Dinghuibacter silviterrae TaxID=1539049 RepID=A0A4V3GM70_9BACT|nr:hypothetical protein EDB95_3369 [Dinghuibacter silviterrae]
METLRLSDIIGQEILELRYQYDPDNEWGFQSFNAYIKLASGRIIDIPNFDHDEYLLLTQENLDYFQKRFDTGSNDLYAPARGHLIGQKIVDFLFCYCADEIDHDYSAFIQLSNGYYLTETTHGQIGTGSATLYLFDEQQFLKRKDELKRRLNIDIHSFYGNTL